MPIYEYQHVDPADAKGCSPVIEVMRGIKADPLTVCPTCGKPVHRMISVPGKFYKNKLSSSALGEMGFTQYKRHGDGEYHKTAGKGADTLIDPR